MYSTLRTVTACLYTERDLGPFLLVLVTFRIHLIAVDFCCFFYFLLFLLSSGWPWPRLDYIDRDSRRWKRRARCVSSTPIIWCPLAVSPIASVNAPLFFFFSLFPRFRVGMDVVSSHTTLDNFSLWRRFSSKTSEWVCRPVSRRQFDPFPDGNLFSLPFLTSCYVPPNSSTNGTNWICFSIFFSLSFPLFIEITSFFFFFLKIEICGFPPQNAIAFISFLFFVKQERYQ